MGRWKVYNPIGPPNYKGASPIGGKVVKALGLTPEQAKKGLKRLIRGVK